MNIKVHKTLFLAVGLLSFALLAGKLHLQKENCVNVCTIALVNNIQANVLKNKFPKNSRQLRFIYSTPRLWEDEVGGGIWLRWSSGGLLRQQVGDGVRRQLGPRQCQSGVQGTAVWRGSRGQRICFFRGGTGRHLAGRRTVQRRGNVHFPVQSQTLRHQ